MIIALPIRTQTHRCRAAPRQVVQFLQRPADSVASPSANGSALRVSSGANPINRNRHRQACRKGANNHQGECEKRICLWAGVVYRHVAYSTTRINQKAAGTNAVMARTRVQEVRSDGAQRWLTKG